jgi:hypothetical protein
LRSPDPNGPPETGEKVISVADYGIDQKTSSRENVVRDRQAASRYHASITGHYFCPERSQIPLQFESASEF